MAAKKFIFSILFAFVFCEFWCRTAAQTAAPLVKVQPNTNWCLACICEAASNCTRALKCDGSVCGLFRITWPYWADSGKPTLNNEDPNSNTAYGNCANDEKCAETIVTKYLSRFQQDCNHDGIIDCNDYAAIHLFGGYGCSQPLTGEYNRRFSECNSQIQTLGTKNDSSTK